MEFPGLDKVEKDVKEDIKDSGQEDSIQVDKVSFDYDLVENYSYEF